MKEGSETTVSAEYLKKPYARMVVPEQDGSFRAEIQEFSGCIALAPTAAEALSQLEEVAAEWIDAALAKGQRIPDPTESAGYSGKLVLRLAKSLHRKAAYAANRDGVSLNQFIVGALAEHVGAVNAASTWTAVNFVRAGTLTFGHGPIAWMGTGGGVVVDDLKYVTGGGVATPVIGFAEPDYARG
jgi:predicted HicB family RNase H-like nuclease